MSSRTLVNLIAVVLFAVAATLIGAVVMKSGAPPEELEAEQRRAFRLAEAEVDARQNPVRTAAASAAPAIKATTTETTKQWFAPPDTKNDEVVKRLEEAEFAKIDERDPGRTNRRKENAEKASEALKALMALRHQPTQEAADALEAALETLRKLPTDFRDFEKPLVLFYQNLNRPFTAKPHPEKPGEWHIAYKNQLTKDDWTAYFAFLKQWQEFRPDSATPLVIRAKAMLSYAWEARGTGYADSVTDESWELFRDRIQEGLAALEAADKTGNADPEYYRMRIIAEKASGGDRNVVYDCIEKCRKICPDYWEIYEAAADFLLPRWHGFPGEVEELANRLHDELGDDIGKLAFFRIAFIVHLHDHYTVIEGRYDPAKLRSAAATMMTHHGLLFGYTRFALLAAWVTEDHELSMRCRDLLAGQALADQQVLVGSWILNGVRNFSGKAGPPKDAKPAALRRWHQYNVVDFEFFADGLIVTNGHLGFNLRFFRGPEFELGGAKPLEGSACKTLHVLENGARLFHDLTDNQTTHAVSFPRQRGADQVLFDAVKAHELLWAWSPDEKLAVGVANNGQAHVWNTTSGAKEREFSLGSPNPTRLHFTPDGKQLIAVQGNHLKMFDLDGALTWHGTEANGFPYHCNQILGPAQDGRMLFCGAKQGPDKTKFGWHLWTPGESEPERVCDSVPPAHARLSRDGRLLAWSELTAEPATVVYDLETRQEIERVKHHTLPSCAAISPDNAWLVVGFNDGAIRFWRLPESVQVVAKKKA